MILCTQPRKPRVAISRANWVSRDIFDAPEGRRSGVDLGNGVPGSRRLDPSHPESLDATQGKNRCKSLSRKVVISPEGAADNSPGHKPWV